MKRMKMPFFVVFAATFFALAACNSKETTEQENATATDSTSENVESGPVGEFGDKLSDSEPLDLAQFIAMMSENKTDSLDTKIEAEIIDVCQMKGCWMKLDIGDGKTMRVSFKDYSFFVPKDAKGQIAVIEGKAKREVVDVETLKHYAQESGEENLEEITEPKEEISFVANAVKIKNKD
ncbi:MAG: DUF4920 domain-containing protein [Cyclobacteriaceae bacterium]|nr:DUF4920 domain-containing protein [Cyclobacteriaceae bacterium]